MLRLVRGLLLIGVLSVGCVPTQPIEVPDIPADGSALMLVSDGSTKVEAWALNPGDEAPAFVLGPGDRVWVLVYESSNLALLNLLPGKLQLDLRPNEGRLLPQGFVMHEALAERPSFEVVDDLSQLESAVGRRPLPDFEKSACTDGGSCQRYVGPGIETASESPCSLPMPESPALPNAPALPRFETCPAGWSHEALDSLLPGLRVCEPPLRQATCANGSLQAAGSSQCVALGVCPAAGQDFAVVAAPALYVHPGAPAGGDGTMGSPLPTIDEALARGATTVALAKGTHVAPQTAVDGITFVGACAAETIIDVADRRWEVTDAAFRTLSIEGVDVPPAAGVRASVLMFGSGVLEDVEMRALQPLAIGGGQVTATRLRLRVNSPMGRSGAYVYGSGLLQWTSGSVEGAVGNAVYGERSEFIFDDLYIGTVATSSFRTIAVFAQFEGSKLTVRRSHFGQATGNNIAVWDGTGLVEDVTFNGALIGTQANVLDAHRGGVMDAKRVVARNVDNGPWAFSDATIRLEDAVILSPKGNGATVNPDCTLSLKRVVMANVGANGVRIRNDNDPMVSGTVGPVLQLEDVSILGAEERGVNAELDNSCLDWPYLGLTTQIDRVLIKNTGNDGVRLFTSSDASAWQDLTIQNTGRHGFLAAIDSAVPMRRVLVDGAQRVGVWLEQHRMDLPVAEPFVRKIVIEDLTVEGAQRGVMASGMLLEGNRWAVRDSTHSGIAIIASEGSLRDISVDGVQEIQPAEPFPMGRAACYLDAADAFLGFASGCIGIDTETRETGTGIHFCGYRIFNVRPLFETEMTLSRSTVSNFARYGVSAYRFSAPELMDVGVVQAEGTTDGARAGIVMSAGLDPERVLSPEVRLKCVSRPLAVE